MERQLVTVFETACQLDKSKIKLLSSEIVIIKEQYKIVVEFEYEEVNSIVFLSLHHTIVDEIEWEINRVRHCKIKEIK